MRVHRDAIHDACRQYLHRMIICLGDQVLPFIPIAVNSLLKDCEVVFLSFLFHFCFCFLKRHIIKHQHFVFQLNNE